MDSIPYARQQIDESDIQAVVDVLRSDYLTQGPAVPAFEQAVAVYCHAAHAIALNSATSALHLACLVLGVKQGDMVWTSPITFVASANCALYCGARIDFVDIDPSSYNMSVACLTEKLHSAEQLGCLPKVLIVVHMAGQPCDMAAIHTLSRRYDFKIIEDASHAIGGKYAGEPIGNCRYSDICVFSFHPVKIMTTGEGGMLLTQNPSLAQRVKLLRSHGITRNAAEMNRQPDGPWYYQQLQLGYNYRMTDLQAALGLSQLARLDEFVTERHQIAQCYDNALRDLPLSCPWQDPLHYSAFHLYIIRLQGFDTTGHQNIFEKLRASGVGVNLHYIPVYLQPYYQQLGFRRGYCQEAEHYYAEAISLPLYPGLTDAEQSRVIMALNYALVSDLHLL